VLLGKGSTKADITTGEPEELPASADDEVLAREGVERSGPLHPFLSTAGNRGTTPPRKREP
jgi:hypothetical protein